MTIKRAYQLAERNMYQYQKLKRQVAEYAGEAGSLKGHDISGERVISSGKSDPTADDGLRLAEPPREIAQKMAWIWAIESALDRLRKISPEKARLFEEYYGLNHRNGRPRSKAAYVRDGLLRELNVSYRGFYSWKKDVVEAVLLAACQKGAVKVYKERA